MEVHLELGAALLRSGDREGAASAFDTAAGLARTVGVAEGVARAALGFGAGLGGFEVRMFDQRQIAMLEEALAALPDVDSGLRSRVLARLAVAVSFVADDARRVELADAAVQMARRLGDDDALASALAAHCDAIAGPAHVTTRLEESAEIVALARAGANRELELLGRRMRVVVRFEMGDRPALEREVDEYAAVAGGVGLPLYSWYATLWRGALALADGRIDDAKACNEEVDAVGAAGYSHNATMLAWVQRFVIARDSGRLPDVIPEVVEAMHTDPELASNPASQATTAAMREVAGEHRAASGVLDLLAGGLLARYADDSEWLPAMCSMAEAAWLCRHRSAAEVLYDVLAPYAGMWGVEGIGAGVHGAVDRHLGLLAHVLGNRPAARRHLEDALAAHRRFGAPLLAQRVVDDLAALGEQPAPAVANRFARDGDGWALTHRGRTVHVRDAKGLHDIAALLAVAGREVHVADLMGTVEATGRAGADVDLDDQARAAYRRRIVELQEELDEAEAAQDTGRAGSARAELEYLVAELSGALGLGGRSRRSGDPGERARKAVTNRIGNAIDRVERVHPELGRHLRRSITTGTFCSYQPEQPEPWVL
jgi:hypothetical protein